jgi:hypothetical protein
MAPMPTPAYPWYAVVSGKELEQGDLLLDCPVLILPPEAARAPANFTITARVLNVIVMTQSCDLTLRPDGRCAVEDVVLSPIYTRQDLSSHKVYGKTQGWEEARKGRHAGFHVLNCCEIPGHELDFMLVDLRRIFTLGVGMLREVAASRTERVRLLPPYREHLSQAFARFFMRVGLPVDISPFK